MVLIQPLAAGGIALFRKFSPSVALVRERFFFSCAMRATLRLCCSTEPHVTLKRGRLDGKWAAVLLLHAFAILPRSKKVTQSRLLWVLGRKSAGGTRANGPQGGRWVC